MIYLCVYLSYVSVDAHCKCQERKKLDDLFKRLVNKISPCTTVDLLPENYTMWFEVNVQLPFKRLCRTFVQECRVRVSSRFSKGCDHTSYPDKETPVQIMQNDQKTVGEKITIVVWSHHVTCCAKTCVWSVEPNTFSRGAVCNLLFVLCQWRRRKTFAALICTRKLSRVRVESPSCRKFRCCKSAFTRPDRFCGPRWWLLWLPPTGVVLTQILLNFTCGRRCRLGNHRSSSRSLNFRCNMNVPK